MSTIPFTVPEGVTTSESIPRHGGIQYRFGFPNGRGASVIRHQFSYGHEDGLWELAVTNAEGHLDYSTPITDDVVGRIDEAEVSDLLARIAALPEPEPSGAPQTTPLIVNLPSLAIGGQVWVRTEAGEPLADWRPHPHATWTPLGRDEAEGGIGGSVEVAP